MKLKMYAFFVLFTIETAFTHKLLNDEFPLLNNDEPENDIVNLLMSKGYLPEDKELPKTSPVKTSHDETFLLSKLSDEDLIKLLNKQSGKSEYYFNNLNNAQEKSLSKSLTESALQGSDMDKIIKEMKNDNKKNLAYFRLENKPLQSHHQKNDGDYNAWKKLNSLLNFMPQQDLDRGEKTLDDEKRELLFDILVAQLKALCCKKKSKFQESLSNKLQKILINQYLPKANKQNSHLPHFKTIKQTSEKSGEFLFLIINEEISSKSNDDVVLVDPESLDKNSSVLLLGPITKPLSDEQLKTVMNRISNELSKPEYISLLEQLSNGTLSENNKGLIDNFVFGPATRRYIKAHRCNHQSKLARVYGGPKWLICTGYLNINTPSLYD